MRTVLCFLSINLLVQFGLSQTASTSLWVGFRYDEGRVISYTATMEDPVEIKMRDLKPFKVPVTRDSSCGYDIPLTEERLRTFKPIDGTVPRIGQQVTVLVGGDVTVAGAVEGYLEEWQGDPKVAVALIARIQEKDQARFKNTMNGYFLISTQARPVSPQIISDPGIGVHFKTTKVLNRFGFLGNLMEREAEAGRDIRLFRSVRGSLQPTAVAAGCGD